MTTVKKFDLHAKNVFLTYPQCSTDIQLIMDAILVLGDVRWAVVAAELHKDGTDHRHVIISFHKKKRFANAQVLDILGGKHGNYQACRKVKDVLRYITKENTWISHNILVEEYLARKDVGLEWQKYARLMDGGMTVDELRKIDPGFAMRWLQRIQEYESFVLSNAVVVKDKWEGINHEGMSIVEKEVAQWLNGNLFCERVFKQPQLYLFGPPSVGKTSLIRALGGYCRIYCLNDEAKFMDGYVSGQYDLIVVDEFAGRRTATFYNQLLQGGSMPLPSRYKRTLKMDMTPVIVCSNFPISYFKYDAMAIAAMSTRLKMVQITGKNNMFALVARLYEVPIIASSAT